MASISVCLPIYYKESVETIRRCFASLEAQTFLPTEVVCALDDPTSPEIENVLDEIARASRFEVIKCYASRGCGLGAILNTAVLNCHCEYIARMDVDDIAAIDRLEKESRFLDSNPDIDVVGSCIAEFDTSPDQIIAYRNVPEDDFGCKKMLKRRDPVNHMTAMYRKDSVLRSGNYSTEMKACEDTYLWVSFYEHGLKFSNIQENLVYVHAGCEMYARRGGMKSFKYVKKSIDYKRKVGLIGYFESFFQIVSNFLVLVIFPNKIRSLVYKLLLRNISSPTTPSHNNVSLKV